MLAGISFLEELDIINTPQEKSSQVRALMSRLKVAHQDALAAAAVVQEFVKAAEHEKKEFETKKKLIEDCGQ